jgi:uncharacterized protein (TIGR02594 family)
MKTILLIPRLAMFLKAMNYYGLTEITGIENNPQILTFFHEIGKTWVQDDETAWCSAFVNFIAMECGCNYSGKLDARSWLNIGKEIKFPELGDIVVFWRETKESWKGHVGLFVAKNESVIYTLGGNQDNQINIKPYPKGQLLSFRRLEYL